MKRIVRREPEPGQKTCLVVRYGAWGDAVFITPVLKYLKQDGYHITINVTEKCYDILKSDPRVDVILFQTSDEVRQDGLIEYWEKLKVGYDRYINFSGSLEDNLILTTWKVDPFTNDKPYFWTHDERHTAFNRNYQDETMKWAGYEDKKGEIPELHFTEKEELWAKNQREKSANKFQVVWALTGSSYHKTYPYASETIHAILDGIKESEVIAVGEAGCYGIVEPHERFTDLCGGIGIRKSYILTKYADLVVSTETSVACAASCYETPKIVLMSHASPEQLGQYWKNFYPVYEKRVPCYPCHQLHYDRDSCPLDKILRLPLCMSYLKPEKVLEKVEEVYSKYQEKRKW